MRRDFRLVNHGSITILTPLTEAARDWVNMNLPTDRMEWAGGTVVEPRYVEDILSGIEADGLTVC